MIQQSHKYMTYLCDCWIGLWSVMYLSACWSVVVCDRSCICVIVERFNKQTNTWAITGHNDSTITQIHDRSQATMIQQSHKYMTYHRPQRFNNHTNVIGHVFVCLLKRCGLWSVMYLCDCWIVVAYDLACICLIVESLWHVVGHVFVWLLDHCGLWSVTKNTTPSEQIHDRSQATTIQQSHKYMTDHRPQRFNNHTNTWPITDHNVSTSTQKHDRSHVVACDGSCICVIVESLWSMIGHVFVC
jgi:hypothetical protein